jgi:hypothetical protein
MGLIANGFVTIKQLEREGKGMKGKKHSASNCPTECSNPLINKSILPVTLLCMYVSLAYNVTKAVFVIKGLSKSRHSYVLQYHSSVSLYRTSYLIHILRRNVTATLSISHLLPNTYISLKTTNIKTP